MAYHVADYLAPTLPGADSVVQPGALVLDYGGQLQQTLSFTLDVVGDNQPPELTLISPIDDAYLPLASTLDVRFRVRDPSGVASLKYRWLDTSNAVLAGPTPLPGESFSQATLPLPGGIVVPPQGFVQLTLQLEAEDNASPANVATATASIRVVEGNPPRLVISEPAAHGTEVHEGEPLTVRVQLEGVPSAQLYLDSADGSEHTALATFGSEGSHTHTVTLDTTAVTGGVAQKLFVLRLESSTGLVKRRFITVVNDDGVEEPHGIQTQPNGRVLAGTDVWVNATVPPTMVDYNPAASWVRVTDGDGETYGDVPDDGSWHPVAVPVTQPTGGTIEVQSELHDRSANHLATSQSLDWLPYYTEAGPTSWEFEARSVLWSQPRPSLTGSGRSLWVGINSLFGGWTIQGAQGPHDTLAGRTTGQLVSLHDTGLMVVAEVEDAHKRTLVVLEHTLGEGWDEREVPMTGELLGVAGRVAFVGYGDTLSGMVLTPSGTVDLVGVELPHRVAVEIAGDQLLVLAGEVSRELYGVRLSDGLDGAALEVVPTTLMSGDTVLSGVAGDHIKATHHGLVVWDDTQLALFEHESGDPRTTLTLRSTLDFTQGDAPSAVAVDAFSQAAVELSQSDSSPLIWIQQMGPAGRQVWQAYAGSLVGLPTLQQVALEEDAAQKLLFDVGLQYRLYQSASRWRLEQRAVEPSQLDVLSAGATVDTTFHPTQTVVTLTPVSDASAGRFALRTTSSDALPMHWTGWPGQLTWNLDTRALAVTQNADQIVLQDEGSGTDSMSLDLTLPASSSDPIVSTVPSSAQSLTQGARLPVKLTMQGAVAGLTLDGGGVAWSDLYGVTWLAVHDSSATQALSWAEVDGTPISPALPDVLTTTTPIANALSAQPALTWTAPSPSSLVVEGQRVEVQLEVAHELEMLPLRYTEVALLDGAGVVKTRVLIGETDIDLSLTAPGVAVPTTYTLRARSYYGDSYAYVSGSMPIRIDPALTVPVPDLQGVPEVALEGLMVPLEIANVGGFEATLELLDEGGHVLEQAGEATATFTIGAGYASGNLTVRATLSNRGGVSRSTTESFRVRGGLALRPEDTTSAPFAYATPDVERLWAVHGRTLLRNVGHSWESVATLPHEASAAPELGYRSLHISHTDGQVSQFALDGGGDSGLMTQPLPGAGALAVGPGVAARLHGDAVDLYDYHGGLWSNRQSVSPGVGALYDIAVHSDQGFVVAGEQGLARIDAGHQATALSTDGGYHHLVEVGAYLMAVGDGRVASIDRSGFAVEQTVPGLSPVAVAYEGGELFVYDGGQVVS
ncbi:MAG: hypothetical protein AAFX99_18685, partial [Myxococcota bacterium]